MEPKPPTQDDPSNGYEAVASEFMAGRQQSTIGVATVRAWGRSFSKGASILDLGCGCGVPISQVLMHDGFVIYGVDASPTLVAAFRNRFPDAVVACEAVERSDFFGRVFDGAIAVGLMFLLSAEAQRDLIRRVALALNPGGRFLFTSPAQACTWTDLLTGRQSLSLGRERYKGILSDAGFTLVGEDLDEGDNYHYDARRQPETADSGG
jgi:SAM-dependent methyltransferase